MALRAWLVALLGLLALTSVGGAAVVYTMTPEQLVEGHTEFLTISNPQILNQNRPFAAAVAVLVREATTARQNDRFPGVLWSNDQYLVDPGDSSSSDCAGASGIRLGPLHVGASCKPLRYPCTGAVLAVNAGDIDPRLLQLNPALKSAGGDYVDSYGITDPNDKYWQIDHYDASGENVWAVGIHGKAATSNASDDGRCNLAPFKDNANHNATTSAYGYPGYQYPCGAGPGSPTPPKCPQLQYNAVLFFNLTDLHVVGAPKNHTGGSSDYLSDTSGCDPKQNAAFTDQWPCPNGDDGREGNSHPYNPQSNSTGNIGRVEHGGSADCTGDGNPDRNCHATRFVDIYFGTAPYISPANVHWATYGALQPGDGPYANQLNEQGDPFGGSRAPYHCNQGIDPSDSSTSDGCG